MGKNLKGKELGKGIGQRKDGRYEARAIINGEKIILYDLNLNELKRRFESEKDRLRKKDLLSCNNVTLGDWFEVWFPKYKVPTLKSTGIATYKRKYINTYGKLLHDVNITEIKQLTIQSATEELISGGTSPKYTREGLAVLKSMLDAAVGNGMMDRNPTLGVIVPTFNEVKEDRRVLTKSEQDTFLCKIESDFYKEAYMFMLSTGVRIGELGALQWSDIDFKNQMIHIRHSLSCQYENGQKLMQIVTPKTKNSIRKIPFFGETEGVLLAQKEKQNNLRKQLGDSWRTPAGMENIDFVFTTSMGSPITRYVMKERLDSISKDINNDLLYSALLEKRMPVAFDNIHPHSLRHTFATRCLEKGMSIEVLQRIMGHANINMTMGYVHILDDLLKNEAAKMGNFLIA